jgi:hypothetical protein
MLTEPQLREIGAAIEEVLQISLNDPNGFLNRLLEIACTEVYQQLKARVQAQHHVAA